MPIRLRISAFIFACLLAVVPITASAQSAPPPPPSPTQSDVSGGIPQSDVSGNVTQSDLLSFQSDEARLRVADVAERLRQALQAGTIDAALPGRSGLSVPPALVSLLLNADDPQEVATQVTAALTRRGLPSPQAEGLAQAVAGLVAEGAPTPAQLGAAGQAFNEAVEAAPDRFLVRPPQSFVTLHVVLGALLQGAAA